MKNILQNLKKNQRVIIILVLTVAICISVFGYYGNEKEIAFCDEVYTYTIVNHGIGLKVRDNRWYVDGEMDYRLNSSSGYFGYKEAIEITGRDVHPPVYYLVFKTFSMLFPYSTSKWIGLLTNLTAYIPMLCMIYWEIWKISKKPWLAAAFTILFAAHPGIQGCALLIRMYFLLALWLIVFFMQTKQLCEKSENKWWLYVALGITTFLGFMTQYYFAVYVVLFSIFWGIDALYHKKWKQLAAYMGAMITAVGASVCFFPQWIEHIFYGYKGQASIETLNSWANYGAELKETFSIIGDYVFPNHGYLYWIVLTVIMICFLTIQDPKLKQTKKHVMMHFAAQILYYCIIAHVMPSVESRYFWSVISVQMFMLVLMLVYFLESQKVFEKKKLVIGTMILSMVYALTAPVRISEVPNLGTEYKEGRITMEQYAHVPWIYYGERNWRMHCTAFDILIPDYLMYIRDLSTLVYDEILQSSQEIVIYAQSEEEIAQLIGKLEEVSGYECSSELLAKRAYNYAYLVTFQY